MRVGPTVEAVADARQFSLAPRSLHTRCGGLFLFLPLLAGLDLDALAKVSRLPGSRMMAATSSGPSNWMTCSRCWSARSDSCSGVVDQKLER